MEKYCVTYGVIAGKPQEIKAPGNYDEHRQSLKDMVDKGGKIGRGKGVKQVSEATIFHSSKGIMKRRKFKV